MGCIRDGVLHFQSKGEMLTGFMNGPCNQFCILKRELCQCVGKKKKGWFAEREQVQDGELGAIPAGLTFHSGLLLLSDL